MATTFKTFLNDDVVSTRSLLHEAIPITGTILSGTYQSSTSPNITEDNIKDYPHGMFQSVYDYPYLSSSANHIFDITLGTSTDSLAYTSGVGVDPTNDKKKNIYNQMAQVLVGHDATGSIMQFDEDGDMIAGGTKLKEVFFINFARLIGKDEIKKGSFSMNLGTTETGSSGGVFDDVITVSDDGAENDYRVNSPAGEYGILKTSGDDHSDWDSSTSALTPRVGLIYYQAGIVVLSASVFVNHASTDASDSSNTMGKSTEESDFDVPADLAAGGVACADVHDLFEQVSISGSCNAFRRRIQSVEFNNTTELNSTVYFCRANHNDFNYSANPTYLSGSKIRVKRSTVDAPVSYFTTIGLYSSDNELLAVAKVSEPLRKDPTNEMILRVRLDY